MQTWVLQAEIFHCTTNLCAKGCKPGSYRQKSSTVPLICVQKDAHLGLSYRLKMKSSTVPLICVQKGCKPGSVLQAEIFRCITNLCTERMQTWICLTDLPLICVPAPGHDSSTRLKLSRVDTNAVLYCMCPCPRSL